MIIYFINASKIYSYKLPSKMVGNYILNDYDLNGIKRNLVSVSAENDSWVMHDNDEVKIISNNTYVSKMTLSLYSFYELVAYGTEKIYMYIMPYYDNSYTIKSMNPNSSITIGQDPTSDIIYSNTTFGQKQATLTYQNNKYIIQNNDLTIPMFVNNVRQNSTVLNNFDVVFFMGLKIVVLGDKIFVNNPNNMVKFNDSKFLQVRNYYLTNETTGSVDLYKDFYEEKDYFYKMPTFKKSLVKYNFDLASPPEKPALSYTPLLLNVGPSFLMAGTSLYSFYAAFTNKGEPVERTLSLIAAIAMLAGTIVWPFIERAYERANDLKNEAKRVRNYRAYLKTKEAELAEENANQKQIIKFKSLSLEDCVIAIKEKNANLFSREYSANDFLDVELGVGTADLLCNINYNKVEYAEVKDVLNKEIDDMLEKYKTIDDCPFVVNLYEKNKFAFIGTDDIKNNYLNAILLQLVTHHSYEDLKIVLLTDNSCQASFKYLKNSNFCFSDDKSYRFFSTSFEEGSLLSDYLEKIFNKRLTSLKEQDATKSKEYAPYYLLLSDNISLYKNVKIVKDLLALKENVGFGIVMFDSKVANIPDGCLHFVNYSKEEGNYFKSEMEGNDLKKFKPNMIGLGNSINMEEVLSNLANIPLKIDLNLEGKLPDSLGFLEMYGVGNVEQLNVLEKWQNSNITTSLKSPIGVDTNNNILNLDLHEKRHGPHGLIAGMTGSGKSEFIITYILSLAVNYSPFEVQFVLIDYKGGGLAGAFENRKTGIKLPHLVGTITNLDKSEMKRTLVSVKSELQRRQRIFNEAKEKLNTGTIDIYKYQRLVREKKLDMPLSHLFIICDEFAELKAQQPEFMDELISTARIGRSLGVHLILATQKPSGVVDDQIWSNSKFKVCCKVQTPEDSKEMIKRDSAAYLKEAGRFYLQVGYDEYFVLGQSAYTGTKYVPSDKIKSKISNSIEFISDQGDIIKSVDDKSSINSSSSNMGEELTNVLEYLIEKSKEIGYQNQNLWLENIPKEIYVDNLNEKYKEEYSPSIISPLIGEYDDPKNQSQGPVYLDINHEGNTLIAGIVGSGKSTLLSTFIYQTIIKHNTQSVNFYMIDLLNEQLLSYAFAPQVGNVLTINDKDEISTLMYFLRYESDKRKKYYSKKGGNFLNDIENGVNVFPSIVVMINGIDAFKEQFESLVDDIVSSLTRDCNRNGIYFIATGTSVNSLGYQLDNNFSNKILLRVTDVSDYDIFGLNREDRIIPNTNPGRGLIKNSNVYEFQTALIENYDKLNEKIKNTVTALNNANLGKAKGIPKIPSKVTLNCFSGENISINSIPIGLELDSGCPFGYNFNNSINLITYAKEQTFNSFITGLVDIFSYLNNLNIIVFSLNENVNIENEKVKVYKENFKAVMGALYNNFSKLVENNNDKQYLIVVDNISLLSQHFNNIKEESMDENVKTIDDLIMLTSELHNVRFILAGSVTSLPSIDNYPWYSLVNLSNGIILGTTIDNQELFISQSSYSSKQLARDNAVVLIDGIQYFIKIVSK